MNIKRLNLIILVIIFTGFYDTSFASENYDSCKFSFESDDAETHWELSFLRLGLNVDNPKEQIYYSLCSFSPNSTFIQCCPVRNLHVKNIEKN